MHLKNDAVYLSNCYKIISHKAEILKKNMDLKQDSSRSPYRDEAIEERDDHLVWIRGSWFPPSNKTDIIYSGQYDRSLFEAP